MIHILNHLTNNCDGFDNTDNIDIRLTMSRWWDKTPSVTKYILWMKKGQKKSARANCPIENKYLALVATRSLRAALAFSTKSEAWYKLRQPKRMSVAWGKAFLTSHSTASRANKVNKKCGNAFGSANTSGPIDRAPAHTATTTASDILP